MSLSPTSFEWQTKLHLKVGGEVLVRGAIGKLSRHSAKTYKCHRDTSWAKLREVKPGP
jgi:hypothetical protein